MRTAPARYTITMYTVDNSGPLRQWLRETCTEAKRDAQEFYDTADGAHLVSVFDGGTGVVVLRLEPRRG